MFQKGERIFMAGAAGEPTALVRDALAAGTHLFTTFVPGVNRLDPAWLGEGSRVTALFAHPGMMRERPDSFDRLPISYGGFLKLLRDDMRFDTAVIQLSPPDAQGRYSLGPMAEFSLLAARRARRTIALVNVRTPHLPGAPSLSRQDFDGCIEADTALPTYAIVEDEAARHIAGHILRILPDRPTLQLGLGKIPNALTQGLSSLRKLRFHSGMISDGIMALDAAGALDRDAPHRTTALLGSPALYEWARDHPEIRIAGCDEIHDPRILHDLDRLVAINSALEVDLSGQCDLEFAGGRAISGPGGAPDFARAASLSPGGCSIIALPASANGASRIVPRLSSGHVSLGRSDVDIVVTEHGIADLRGKDVAARREALIAIASPDHRSGLAASGKDQ
ncbi:acetyl-CoA hydrolase [Sphingobium faniae]|nr:acetyl-CoA hydrolase [Sphingobium faniae]